MAMFGQQTRKDDSALRPEPSLELPVEHPPLLTVAQPGPTRIVGDTRLAESILAAGLTIEGKIEGIGNIRVAGRFQGNVNVKGELTIEPGASIDGEVKADTVFVGGEVHGQIIATSRVEFKDSGALIGDLKAGSLTVAAGSRMRGKVEFGWKDGEVEPGIGAEHVR